jgi:predicted RNase H-like HicB family nuclease
MIFHVTLDKSEDGWVVVECPAMPGCVIQGCTKREPLDNVREAITGWLLIESSSAVQFSLLHCWHKTRT